MDDTETAFQPLLDLPSDLSKRFMVVTGEMFPELTPLDLLTASAVIREAVHQATVKVLDAVATDRGVLPL